MNEDCDNWDYDEDQDLSCQVKDDNGVTHYYDEYGIEVETFIPDWGC